MPGFNAITWFEIGTSDPAGAERFYGEVFGWTVGHDDPRSTDPAYRIIGTGGDAGLQSGGLFSTNGEVPGYAVFAVLVEDVAETCRQAEKAGGTVQRGPLVNSDGFTFAYLLDPSGNQFEVFTPPSGPA
jgi:predicted enzyme related to lactoylglutathione lyase